MTSETAMLLILAARLDFPIFAEKFSGTFPLDVDLASLQALTGDSVPLGRLPHQLITGAGGCLLSKKVGSKAGICTPDAELKTFCPVGLLC